MWEPDTFLSGLLSLKMWFCFGTVWEEQTDGWFCEGFNIEILKSFSGECGSL